MALAILIHSLAISWLLPHTEIRCFSSRLLSTDLREDMCLSLKAEMQSPSILLWEQQCWDTKCRSGGGRRWAALPEPCVPPCHHRQLYMALILEPHPCGLHWFSCFYHWVSVQYLLALRNEERWRWGEEPPHEEPLVSHGCQERGVISLQGCGLW